MRLGVVGGGQLGRMLGQAAQPLDVRVTFLEPADQPCAAVAGEVIRAEYADAGALDQLVAASDAVTYEFENVPVDAARYLAARVPVYPPPEALETAQDRLVEKRFFEALGVEVAPFVPVDSQADLDEAVARLGLPAVLKARRLGYDGKGQRWLGTSDDVSGAYASIGRPCVLEGAVAFMRELSVLAVRSREGEVRTWPLSRNHHQGGILRWTVPIHDAALQRDADAIAARVLEALDYVGVLAVELFQVGERLLANELAPRVHNSGHWTIEGARTSQFENHVRAVLGLPLGQTDAVGPCGMVNLIGTAPPLEQLLAVPGARVHLYGKAPRPGRKIGHVTVLGGTEGDVSRSLERLHALIG